MFIHLLFLITLSLNLTNAVDPCQTPNGQNGDCKIINNCTLLYSHFQQGPISSSTAEYLRKSLCGFERSYPKVCCPIGSSHPPTKTPDLKMRHDFNVVTSKLLPNTSICGIDTKSRIFGGKQTEIDEYPWLVLLEYRGRTNKIYFGCGGALINERYVLTARHCLNSYLKSVRLGEYNTETDPDSVRFGTQVDVAPPIVKIGVEKIIHHNEDDIGLIRLKEAVSYSDFIKPICLPHTNEHLNRSYIGDKVVVAGWGLTEQGNRSNIKLQVKVPIKPLSHCVIGLRAVYKTEVNLHEKQLCAGGEEGKDSCNGDSGGPLMDILKDGDRNSHWYAVGVVSFGPNNPCGQKDRPAVYVKVSEYVPWIVENIKP